MKTETVKNAPEIRSQKNGTDARTVSSIMRSKALDVLERNRLSDIAATWVKFSVASTLAVSAFDPTAAFEVARQAAQWSDYAAPKSAAAFLAVWRWRDLANAAVYGIRKASALVPSDHPDETETPANVPTAFGIPATEMAEFLFEKKGFPRDEFCERFGAGRSTHEKVAKGFDSLGILTRGENNARVLGNVDIGYVVSVLSRADEFGFVPLHDGEKGRLKAAVEEAGRVAKVAKEVVEVGEPEVSPEAAPPEGKEWFTVRNVSAT